MSFENPHNDLDPTNDLKKAENPPGRNLDQKDTENKKIDEKNPEKSPSREKEVDIRTMLAQWRENTDKYIESHPDAKPAVENNEKARKVEDDMMREWP